MKYLLLDTNIYVSDFQMDSHPFQILLSHHKFVADKILLPEIVFEETKSQFQKKVKIEIDSLKKSYRKLAIMLGSDAPSYEELNVNELVEKYDFHYDVQTFDSDLYRIPYPDIPIGKIATRAMARKKPFKQSGVGVCDAIIWESVLEILSGQNDSEIIFVTSNIKDFNDAGGLHADFISELNELEIDPNRISLYANLKSLVDEKIVPKLDLLTDIQLQLNRRQYDFGEVDFEEWLCNTLFNNLDADSIAWELYEISADDCEVSLSEVYEIVDFEARFVQALSEDTRYVRVAATIGLSLDICADYKQYGESELIAKLFDSWNAFPAPYDCVSRSEQIGLEFSLIFQGQDVATSSVEIFSINGNRIRE